MLQCPITLQVFEDPITDRYGHTFERAAITRFLNQTSRHPMGHGPYPSIETDPSQWTEDRAMAAHVARFRDFAAQYRQAQKTKRRQARAAAAKVTPFCQPGMPSAPPWAAEGSPKATTWVHYPKVVPPSPWAMPQGARQEPAGPAPQGSYPAPDTHPTSFAPSAALPAAAEPQAAPSSPRGLRLSLRDPASFHHRPATYKPFFIAPGLDSEESFWRQAAFHRQAFMDMGWSHAAAKAMGFVIQKCQQEEQAEHYRRMPLQLNEPLPIIMAAYRQLAVERSELGLRALCGQEIDGIATAIAHKFECSSRYDNWLGRPLYNIALVAQAAQRSRRPVAASLVRLMLANPHAIAINIYNFAPLHDGEVTATASRVLAVLERRIPWDELGSFAEELGRHTYSHFTAEDFPELISEFAAIDRAVRPEVIERYTSYRKRLDGPHALNILRPLADTLLWHSPEALASRPAMSGSESLRYLHPDLRTAAAAVFELLAATGGSGRASRLAEQITHRSATSGGVRTRGLANLELLRQALDEVAAATRAERRAARSHSSHTPQGPAAEPLGVGQRPVSTEVLLADARAALQAACDVVATLDEDRYLAAPKHSLKKFADVAAGRTPPLPGRIEIKVRSALAKLSDR